MKTSKKFDELKRELNKYPDGITSKRLAQIMGKRHKSVGNLLSRGHNWGWGISFTPIPRLGRAEYLWRVS